MARSLLIVLLLCCGKAGGEITHRWTLKKADRDVFWMLAAAQGCPEIEDHLDTECDQPTLRKSLRSLRLDSHDGGERVEAEVKFDKPE